MIDKSEKKLNFGMAGIILGVFFVLVSIIWVTSIVFHKGKTSGEDVTWVG